jgi:multisubunit Na+/H+ antiporter MnhF subunit
MHDPVFQLVFGWQVVLIALLAFEAVRTRIVLRRVLALDTMALVFVAALAVIALERAEPDYLDLGLVVAMLGFAQTVAAARLESARENPS